MTIADMSLVSKSETAALRIIAESLPKIPEVLKIVVFGSRVRGDFDESSDMDVMIIVLGMETEMKNNIIRIFHDAEPEYDVPISPVIWLKPIL